jgi:hypothetical protein
MTPHPLMTRMRRDWRVEGWIGQEQLCLSLQKRKPLTVIKEKRSRLLNKALPLQDELPMLTLVSSKG